jgi:hypothetical protein
MKTLVSLTALTAIALGLGACTPPKDAYGHWGKQARLMKAVSRLDCPDEHSSLRRVSAAPDGRSCVYSGDDETTVELRLVNVTGSDTGAALAPIEATTHAWVPVQSNTAHSEATAEPPEAPEAPETPAKPGAPTNVSMHPAGGKLPSGRSEDDVEFDLPGIHIHANDDHARVSVAGVHVDADDRNEKVHVERKGHGRAGGDVLVDAHEGGAIIRLDNSDANIRARVMFASETAGPEGDHAAGYVARGPRSGPLVVAVVRMKGDHDHDDDVFGSATSLVKHNTDN